MKIFNPDNVFDMNILMGDKDMASVDTEGEEVHVPDPERAANRQTMAIPGLAAAQARTKKIPCGYDRYLDLFTQLSMVEDSFGFLHLIFYFDPFQCVYAGSAFEKIYGYSCKEIYECSDIFCKAAHPDDVASLMEHIRCTIKNGYHEFTYRIITKNSEVRHLKTNAWCQQEENLSYVVSCYQKDITAQLETRSSLRRSMQKHHFVSDVAIMLNSVDDFDSKLQSVVNRIGDAVRTDQVNLYEVDNESGQMTCRFISAGQHVIVPAGATGKVPPLDSLPGYINTLQFSAGESPVGFMRYWKIPDRVQSLMVVPVRTRQTMFGFIELVAIRKRKWNDGDLSFVSTIGNMTANFYDRKAIDNELKQNYSSQELLASVSSLLNEHTDDREQVLKTVLEHIGKKSVAERIFICRFDGEDGSFRKTHEYVHPSLEQECQARSSFGSTLIAGILPVLKADRPYCINDTAQLQPELKTVLQRLSIRSVLAIPLFAGEQLYGIFGYCTCTHLYTWTKGEIETARAFAGTISHFIERQTFLKKLGNSEKKFRDISAKLPGCVFQATLSPTGEITLDYISPQLEQWTRVSSKTISRLSLKKIQQAIHPNDYETFSRLKDELERLRTEISFEGRFYFSATGFKWLLVKATMLETKPSGELVYNGMFIDITENKQTELKLADADISIQGIINNLETGILLIDDYSNVLYSNEKLTDMLASSRDAEATAGQQPQLLNATYQLVRDSISLKNHTSTLMKKRIGERNKELFFYQTVEFYTRDYFPVFRDHRFFAHLFIFNSITPARLQELEVQKSYKRVRTIIDHSDTGVLLLSENGKVLTVNNRFRSIFQMEEPADYFVNQPFRLLWEKMNGNVSIEGITRELIRDTVYSGKRIVSREITVDETNILQLIIEPVVYENPLQKDIYEILIQIIDITARRNIENTLLKAKEEAEMIAQAKSHILTSMSHEIRTPLNGIVGFSSLLKESLTDPYQKEMAEVIDQSGHRLLDTLNAILDFSILQSENKTFKITPVNVNRMLQEQVNLHRTMALQKGLYLYAEIRGQIGIVIAEQVLYKILNNLINNAVKYTISGGVKIEAGIKDMDGNEWLELKVIDTGVGIDKVKHNTIFEPFRQESEGYGRAFEGAGLGLSLVKKYVQKMNGEIHLDSQKDEGSVFTILLPDVYYDNNDMTLEIIGMPSEDRDTDRDIVNF